MLTPALRRLTSWFLIAFPLVLGAAGGYAWFTRAKPSPEVEVDSYSVPTTDSEDEGTHRKMTVKVVTPKPNRSEMVVSVTQPAYVQAGQRANLMSRVAGVVRAVHKNIGDPIKKDEVLLEIDIPDLVQELGHKMAMVRLANEELRAAEANVDAMRAMAKEARTLIEEKRAEVDRAMSKKRFHMASYRRVKTLADQRAVEASLVDERTRNVEAAEADYKSSLAAVSTAEANVEEFNAKQKQAEVEVKVRQARIDVAKAEVGKAQALVDYSRIRAPFDGIVVARKIDPGAFVQNASTGHPEPLLTVVRSDAMTLVMWVPEREAPLVNTGTEAMIRLDALAKQDIPAKVSRTSQWLDPDKSRDMRVEVDLDNKDQRLRAGMYGSMTLVLSRFDKAMLLPASAVFVRGGQTYVFVVEEGRAKITRVRVQQEDGIRVKVAKVVPSSSGVETLQELTGNERIVRSGQGEIRDGQELHATEIDW